MKEYKTDSKNEMESLQNDLAELIREFMKKSPEHGNAAMDLLGNDTYIKVMEKH